MCPWNEFIRQRIKIQSFVKDKHKKVKQFIFIVVLDVMHNFTTNFVDMLHWQCILTNKSKNTITKIQIYPTYYIHQLKQPHFK